MPPLFLQTIENSSFSVWVRESPSVLAFPTFLAIHTFGICLVAGFGCVINLRLLGVAPKIPLAPLERLYSLIWLGLWLNIVTGVILVLAYPTKQLTNPIFYTKLVLIAVGTFALHRIRQRVFGSVAASGPERLVETRRLAMVSLGCWVGVIAAGRMLAYVYFYDFYPF